MEHWSMPYGNYMLWGVPGALPGALLVAGALTGATMREGALRSASVPSMTLRVAMEHQISSRNGKH